MHLFPNNNQEALHTKVPMTRRSQATRAWRHQPHLLFVVLVHGALPAQIVMAVRNLRRAAPGSVGRAERDDTGSSTCNGKISPPYTVMNGANCSH